MQDLDKFQKRHHQFWQTVEYIGRWHLGLQSYPANNFWIRVSRFALCDASEPAPMDSQLSHQAMAQAQSKHTEIVHRDTKSLVTFAVKTTALSGTTALGFQQAGLTQLGIHTLHASLLSGV